MRCDFQWPDLSTNEAYVGTNWVYTVEMRDPPSASWVPAAGRYLADPENRMGADRRCGGATALLIA